MKRDRRLIADLISRCVRLKCPVCDVESVFASPFKIKHHCGSCGALFQREAGFFVGALSINVVTTEFVILLLYVCSLPFIGEHFDAILVALLALALAFPLAFYHHSWSLWLSFDHFVETLPKYEGHVADPARRNAGEKR